MGEYYTRLIHENPYSEFVCLSDVAFDRAKAIAAEISCETGKPASLPQ